MLAKVLISILFLSMLYQASVGTQKNCIHFERGTVTPWNTYKDMWIDFFIPLDWSTLENKVMTLRFDKLHDLEVVLKPPDQNVTGFDFEEVEFLPTQDLRVGWNRLLLRIIVGASVMIIEGMNREVWLRTPVTFQKGENLKAEITGLSSFVNCNEESVFYSISKSSNVTVPVVLREDDFVDLDILTYSSDHDIRVGINLDGRMLNLCRPIQEDQSVIIDLSVAAKCDPKLNLTQSLNQKGLERFRLTLAIFDQKDYLTVGDYTFPRVSIYNLGADPFMVRTRKQSPVKVLLEEYSKRTSRANQRETRTSTDRDTPGARGSGVIHHIPLLAVVALSMIALPDGFLL